MRVADNPKKLMRHYWISFSENRYKKLVLPALLANPIGLGRSQLNKYYTISLTTCITLSVPHYNMYPKNRPLDQALQT